MTRHLELKPQYRYYEDGHFQELEQSIENVLSLPGKGVWIAVWNVMEERYEFGQSTGVRIERRWDITHLPEGFRAGLLLMGVS